MGLVRLSTHLSLYAMMPMRRRMTSWRDASFVAKKGMPLSVWGGSRNISRLIMILGLIYLMPICSVKKIRWITMDLSHTLQACLHGTKPTSFRYLGPCPWIFCPACHLIRSSMGDKFAFRFNDIEKKVDNIDRRMTKMDDVLEKVLAYVSDVPLDV